MEARPQEEKPFPGPQGDFSTLCDPGLTAPVLHAAQRSHHMFLPHFSFSKQAEAWGSARSQSPLQCAREMNASQQSRIHTEVMAKWE